MKRTLLLAALTLCVALSASAADKKLRFAYSVMNFENPYFTLVIRGFEERCKELGIETNVVDAKYDPSIQYNHIENFIAAKYDAILVSPIDVDGINDICQKAIDSGMIVVSEAQYFECAQAKFTLDEYKYGWAQGTEVSKWINEKLNGECEWALIAQDNVPPVVRRGDGVVESIAKFSPKAKLVSRQTGDTPEQGMRIIEAVLQQYPNIKVVQGTNDSGAIGGYQAVMNSGRAGDPTFYVGGADATDEAIAKMKEPGSVFRMSVDLAPYVTGRQCADKMLEYVKNGPPKEPEFVWFPMTPVWQDEVLKRK